MYFAVQTSSFGDVVLWFVDLEERNITANVVSAAQFIPFVLISWIGNNVLCVFACVHVSSAGCSYGEVHLWLIVKRLLSSVKGKVITDIAQYQFKESCTVNNVHFILSEARFHLRTELQTLYFACTSLVLHASRSCMHQSEKQLRYFGR